MNNPNRDSALLEVIQQGLVLSSCNLAKASLGDRSTYIGLTDLARYRECPRAALLQKIFPQEYTLPQLLTLQRGHWFETGIGHALNSLGLSSIQQLEISTQIGDAPLKAHLDFTLVWLKPVNAVRILEIKSTDNMPETARDSHIFQAQAQAALLQEYWDKPVFSLRGTHGQFLHKNLTFPQICKKRLGLKMPRTPEGISLEGWLLYLSMRNVKAFGPYTGNSQFSSELFRLAEEFWQLKTACQEDNLHFNSLGYAQGFYPLCQTCGFSIDCPKFRDGDSQPQWETAILELDKLKAGKASLETKIKEIEEALKNAHNISGITDWIHTGEHRFRVAPVKGRKILDRELLRKQLSDLLSGMGIENITADDFIAACEKESSPGTRLYINPVK